MDLESQNARDARVEQLWKKLDTLNKGEIDLQGLRRGLKLIDHPLQNAHELLHDVMKAVDTSGDGKIQYQEFRTFVEHTETELLALFQSIDRDNDGNIDKDELQSAFKKAGLAVTPSKLNQFFSEVDTDHNGVISFDEWRNFLLFLPADTPGLKAVLSYYSSTVVLNAEGDSVLSDDTVQGLGNSSFLSILFGAIFRIALPPSKPSTNRNNPSFQPHDIVDTSQSDGRASSSTFSTPSIYATPITEQQPPQRLPNNKTKTTASPHHDEPDISEDMDITKSTRTKTLTSLLPDPGYFAAGGIAGVISRTATAPLDRLKVYLIANTGAAKNTVEAVAKGNAIVPAKHVGRPLIDASKELWRTGGMRSLFAGNGLNVIKVMPESAIKFGSYEGAKRALAHLEGHNDATQINPYSKFVAGGLGGMVSQLVVYPLDTLKFRMQCNVQEKGLRGNALIMSTAKQMWANGGMRTAYRGLTMGLVGMFPYSAIDLGTFEFLKGRLIAYNSKHLKLPLDHPDCCPGSFSTGTIGAFSGAFGASVVYPINLLRTRLQAQGTILHPQTYDGIIDCAKRTVTNEGVRGLFKGITPNLLKVVPAVSITYIVYENSKRIMHLR